jgi:hypothetical protein
MAKAEIHVPVSEFLLAGLDALFESTQESFASINIPFSVIAKTDPSTKKPIPGLEFQVI